MQRNVEETDATVSNDNKNKQAKPYLGFAHILLLQSSNLFEQFQIDKFLCLTEDRKK
jgi:hypothetical protein